MNLSKVKEELFRDVINREVDAGFVLPADLETDKVYRLTYNKHGNRGSRDVRFIVREEAGDFYLDLYLIADDYSMHKRILGSGEVVALENFEGQYGWPIFEDTERTRIEHQRIKEHNEKVYDIL